MSWIQRSDGQPDLAVMVGYDLVAVDDDAIGIRIEYAEPQAQLLGHAPPSTKQIVVTLEAAQQLGEDLLNGSRISQPARGKV